MNLKEREIEVLRELEYWHRKGRLARPMDVGGYNGSHHSYTLGKLAKLGLVEKRIRGVGERGSYRYKITDAGLAALEAKP